jgi:hypothetical protein
VLSLERDDILDELWADLLHVLPIESYTPQPQRAVQPEIDPAALPTSTPSPTTASRALASALARAHPLAVHARALEIFLDHVVSSVESKRCRVLLNPKFTALLSPASRTLRLALENFLQTLPVEAKASGGFQQLLQPLLFMGLRTEVVRLLLSDQTVEGPYHRRMSKLATTLPKNVRAYRHVLEQQQRGGGGHGGSGGRQ